MRNSQPKKYYDLPKKTFLALYLTNAILALVSIATLWVGYNLDLTQLSMTFNAFVLSAIIAVGIIGIINSDKKIRIYSLVYFALILIHLVGWVLSGLTVKQLGLVGSIIETVVFGLVAGFSIFLCITQKGKKRQPKPVFIPPEQQKEPEVKKEEQPQPKVEEAKPVEIPKQIEVKQEEPKAIIPVETKPEENKEIIDIIQVTLE